MLQFIQQPWPWYVSGFAITLIMVLLLYYGKSFGFSSNLRTICTVMGAGKLSPFFNFDWKKQQWNLLFLLGAIIGGFIARTFLVSDHPLQLSAATIKDLGKLGIAFDGGLNPSCLFNAEFAFSIKGLAIFLTGGFLVGFGSRYAGGCTSGHAISGLSNLQLPSLWAVCGFFAGGLFMTHVLFPLIF